MMAPLPYGHAPPPGADGEAPGVGEMESILSDWFGEEVILASSGRAALLLAFRAQGLNRYRSRMAMSPMVSACVLDAVIRAAFPVDAARSSEPADASLVVHQYGFLQKWSPSGAVTEDICHAFFGNPSSGARDWKGGVAVFSLPKFGSAAGMAGGLVVRSPESAKRLRELVDGSPERGEAAAAQDRKIFQNHYAAGGPELEEMYFRVLLSPRPDARAWAGLPTSVAGWAEKGKARLGNVRLLMESMPAAVIDEKWRTSLASAPPFALPMFGEEDRLQRIDRALETMGVAAGVYRVDRNGDASSPDYASALLLPCHDGLPATLVSQMADIIRDLAA